MLNRYYKELQQRVCPGFSPGSLKGNYLIYEPLLPESCANLRIFLLPA